MDSGLFGSAGIGSVFCSRPVPLRVKEKLGTREDEDRDKVKGRSPCRTKSWNQMEGVLPLVAVVVVVVIAVAVVVVVVVVAVVIVVVVVVVVVHD